MELLLWYLKQKKKAIILCFLFSVIFILTFYLYHLPIKAVLYPTLLCVILGIIYLIFDFQSFKKRHNILQTLQNLSINLTDKLPKVTTVLDKDYQNIILALQEDRLALETNMSNKYSDMILYYTVWVHQIKTPIASMRLSLQNQDSAFSRKLSSELFRIEQYVEMVLVYLRLNSESTDYLFYEYDIDIIIKKAIKNFSNEFIEKKISLSYDPINLKIITDEKWFLFVIEQVLSNALKYTNSGFIKIYLKQNKTLCIEDSGIGIASEDLPRIFENGYTGYTGRAYKKASGIGLYLCKTICNKLNQEIKASSTIGVGTTISIDLAKPHTKSK